MRRLPNFDVALKVAPVGATVIHLMVALTHGGPVAVPDVPAYLNVTQRLWGGFAIP